MILFVNTLIALVITWVIFSHFYGSASVRKSMASRLDRRSLNAVIYQERLSELESDRQREAMSDDVFNQLKHELQATLLKDVDELNTSEVATAQFSKKQLVLLLLIPLALMTTYMLMAYDDKLKNWEQAKKDLGPIIESMLRQEDFDREQLKKYDVSTFVRVLQDRQNKNPETQAGWSMLANIFIENGMADPAYVAAKKAYQQAPEDQKPIVQLVEITITKNKGILTSESERLIDQYLQKEFNPSLLALKAGAAQRGGEYQVALDAWQQLYDLSNQYEQPESNSLSGRDVVSNDTLENIEKGRRFLMQTITALKEKLAVEQSDGLQIQVQVGLSELLQSKLKDFMLKGERSGVTLFLYIKDVAGSPMPIAAKKLDLQFKQGSTFPLEVILTQADVMIKTTQLESVESFQLVARLSKSGVATQSVGDWKGSVSDVQFSDIKSNKKPLYVIIDQIVL